MFAWGTTTWPIQNVQTFVELPYTYTDWVSRFPSGSSRTCEVDTRSIAKNLEDTIPGIMTGGRAFETALVLTFAKILFAYDFIGYGVAIHKQSAIAPTDGRRSVTRRRNAAPLPRSSKTRP